MLDLEIYADLQSAYEEAMKEDHIDYVNMLLTTAMMEDECNVSF